MARPKSLELSLKKRMELISQARLKERGPQSPEQDRGVLPLAERIDLILGLIRKKPRKSVTMNFLIMYDIEDDRVRVNIAKYLKKKGCLRIQKSVFMANATNEVFEQILTTLRDVNEMYDNRDSIIIVPVNVSDVRSMKLIGSNVNIDVLVDAPNTLFF